jgi:hypothetical protein
MFFVVYLMMMGPELRLSTVRRSPPSVIREETPSGIDAA